MRNTKIQTPKTNKASNTVAAGAMSEGWICSHAGVLINDLVLRDGGNAEPQRHAFDLEERTALFGERIVRFSKRIPLSPTNNRLIDQLVGAGTSVGANFCEANDCVSKKDFRYTVKRCIKEAKEVRFFLRMIVASEPELAAEARTLFREAVELTRILATMHRK